MVSDSGILLLQAVECGSRPLDDDFEALSTHRRPEVGSHPQAMGSMLTERLPGSRPAQVAAQEFEGSFAVDRVGTVKEFDLRPIGQSSSAWRKSV